MARVETSNVGIRNFRNIEFLNLKAATKFWNDFEIIMALEMSDTGITDSTYIQSVLCFI